MEEAVHARGLGYCAKTKDLGVSKGLTGPFLVWKGISLRFNKGGLGFWGSNKLFISQAISQKSLASSRGFAHPVLLPMERRFPKAPSSIWKYHADARLAVPSFVDPHGLGPGLGADVPHLAGTRV